MIPLATGATVALRRVFSSGLLLGARCARRALSTAATYTDPAIGLTPDQTQILETAQQFARDELSPYAADWDDRKVFPEEALRKAASIGFGGLYVDPAFGGSGLSRLEGSIVVEALAAADTSTTAYLTIHNMVASMVSTHGSEDTKKRFLERLCSMELFASYCLTEPNAGSDAAALATRAVSDGDSYVLNGSKAFISGGGRSDVYAVMVRTGGPGPSGISCVLVENGTPGLSFGKQERKLGWNTQPTCSVFLENCRVPKANRLGAEGEGFKIAMRGLNGGRLSIAACSLGAATTCLHLARDYTKTRRQFGQTLSSNQSVAFTLADMATDVYMSRLGIRDAARLLDAGHPTAAIACASAKKFATDRGFGVCNSALQLHGGYGYLKDFPIERFVRDCRVHQILEGTNQIMNVLVARHVLA